MLRSLQRRAVVTLSFEFPTKTALALIESALGFSVPVASAMDRCPEV